jgi:hypothetical protein
MDMRRCRAVLPLIASLLLAAAARAETFQVRHDHLRGGCKGELVFTDSGVEYRPEKKAKHAASWKYEDIQQMELDRGRITILSYQSSRLRGGADRVFNFDLLSGAVTGEFRGRMASRLSRPVVSSLVPPRGELRFTIPVRLRHLMGASQGDLEFSEQYVVFRTEAPDESRVWRYDELLSMGSTGPFQLRIGTLSKTGGQWGEEKNYVFDLKRRLAPEEYDWIWARINMR